MCRALAVNCSHVVSSNATHVREVYRQPVSCKCPLTYFMPQIVIFFGETFECGYCMSVCLCVGVLCVYVIVVPIFQGFFTFADVVMSDVITLLCNS